MENSKTEKISGFEKASNAFGKVGAFFGNQRHFASIRDAFATFMPLIIVGSFGVLVNSVFIDPNSLLATLVGVTQDKNPQAFLNWTHVAFYLSPIFTGISGATMSFFSIYMAFLFGYFLTGSYGENKVFGGLVGLAAFLTLNPIAAGGENPSLYLGTQGVLMAMFTGLTAPMILVKLNGVSKLKIKMPEGVPPAVADSFSSLLPLMITIVVFGLIQPIWGGIAMASGIAGTQSDINIEIYYLFGAVYKFLFMPLTNAANSPYMIFIILFLIGLFWFFGVHGNNVVQPFVVAFWTVATIQNIDILSSYGSLSAALASGELNIWTEQTMNSFALMGGASSTIALLIVVSIFSKLPAQTTVRNVALPAGVFNISEPVMFGLPIILNPIYFIPFIFTGAIQGMVAYLFTFLGWVNPVTVMVPWTTPMFISGFLSTQDWRSLILTSINLLIALAFYLPFVIFDVKTQVKELSKEENISPEEYLKKQKEDFAKNKIKRKDLKKENKQIKLEAKKEDKKTKIKEEKDIKK